MSTARHQLAGAPGTGTTIDNMASRVKAWAVIDQRNTQTVTGGFGVSSIADGGLGNTVVTLAAAMNGAVYATTVSSWAMAGWTGRTLASIPSTATTFTLWYYENNTPIDSTPMQTIVAGTLA